MEGKVDESALDLYRQSSSDRLEWTLLDDQNQNEQGEKQIVENQMDEKLVRYLYSVEDQQTSNQKTTLESMSQKTNQLFEVVQSQLMNSEHPLAQIASRFTFYFVKHYTNQILFDEKTNDYYLIKTPHLNNEIQYISASEKASIEAKIQQKTAKNQSKTDSNYIDT